MAASDKVQKIIDSMTIEQKIGQCLVIGFVGSVITPEILRRIRTYTPAGVRVGLTMRTKTAFHDPYATSEKHAGRVLRQPRGMVKDFLRGLPTAHCRDDEWCEFLNAMKREAAKSGVGTPLHITLDMEGENSADYPRGGIHYFPSCMGIAKSNDPELARKVAWAVSRQLIPLGFSWIHSPVLDVNTNPLNPEIDVRSYSESGDTTSEYALEALKGFKENKLITTGKHFPGRGASTQDAHGELPVIDISREELEEHLKPFKALIEAGLPSIMTAHTAYPKLDPSGRPATLSKPILTDLLKNELGFKGAITTDDITMGGIVAEFTVAEACIEALNAGADLILFRDESNLLDEVFPELVEAVKSGRLPEERLNDALERSLSVKEEYGLFENDGITDPAKASEGIRDEKVSEIAVEAAESVVSIFRNEDNIIPLPKDKKILLIEQVPPLYTLTNDQKCHPGILWESTFEYSDNVAMVETEMAFTDDDRKRVFERIDEADILVVTNYYYRRGSCGNDFIKELHETGKPVLIITNCPYPQTVSPEYRNILMSYGISPESVKVVARYLFEPGSPGGH